MIDADSVRELIETYEKHGWLFRRVLLTPALSKAFRGDEDMFGDVPVKVASIDAAWFSRPPKPGGIAWELRYLGDPPYALLEKIDENSPDLEDVLTRVEDRLSNSVGQKTNSLTTERTERQT